jgi:hypothetical protein
MRCSEVNLLLLSHLDGALSEYDEARLAEHIAGCDACAREISSQKRLSGALHEIGQEEFQAPPELCSLVMTKLRTQRGKSLIWLPAAWRKAIASAAAVLLLAGGSAGIAGGLKIADIGKMIGWHTSTPPVNIETAGGVSVTENNPSEEPSAAGIAANNAYNPVITGDTPEDSVDKIKDNDAGSSGVDNDAGKITTVPSVKGPRALLGSDMEITSTVLTVAVEDMNEARAKAVALAAGAEAATQVFPEQSGDKKVVVIRIAADRDDAPGLVAALSGVGLLSTGAMKAAILLSLTTRSWSNITTCNTS